MSSIKTERRFVLCIDNQNAADLEKRKLYQVLPDKAAEKDGYLRVIDESGEDYLYPSAYFVSVRVPLTAQGTLQATG
jgi:hypothetical protein